MAQEKFLLNNKHRLKISNNIIPETDQQPKVYSVTWPWTGYVNKICRWVTMCPVLVPDSRVAQNFSENPLKDDAQRRRWRRHTKHQKNIKNWLKSERWRARKIHPVIAQFGWKGIFYFSALLNSLDIQMSHIQTLLWWHSFPNKMSEISSNVSGSCWYLFNRALSLVKYLLYLGILNV